MKNIKCLLLFAMLVVACNEQDSIVPVGQFANTEVDIETNCLNEGSVGVFFHTDGVNGAGYSAENRQVTYKDGEWVVDGEPILWATDESEVVFSAYFPYVPEISSYSEHLISVPVVQDAQNIKSSDFLHTSCDSTTAKESKGVLKLNFKHQLSQFVIEIANRADYEIKEVRIQNAKTEDVFSLEQGAWLSVGSKTATISMFDNGRTFESIMIPQSLGLKIDIDVVDNAKSVTYQYTTAEEHIFKSGKKYVLTLNIAADAVSAVGTIEEREWSNGGEVSAAEEIYDNRSPESISITDLSKAIMTMKDGASFSDIAKYTEGVIMGYDMEGNLPKGLSVMEEYAVHDAYCYPNSGIYIYGVEYDGGFGRYVRIDLEGAKLKEIDGVKAIVWDDSRDKIKIIRTLDETFVSWVTAEDLNTLQYHGVLVAIDAKCIETEDGIRWADIDEYGNVKAADRKFVDKNGVEFLVTTLPDAGWAKYEINRDTTSFIIGVALNCDDAVRVYPVASLYIEAYLIAPKAEDLYMSSDYSKNGEIKLLQEATVGNGIDVVLMGDAYTDRLIENGTYQTAMTEAMEHLFSEEPYKSFREYFNVYMVTVVSKHEDYIEGCETALSGFFGEGTHVGGNDNAVINLTYTVLDGARVNEALVLVIMNRNYYAGTCYMYYPEDPNNPSADYLGAYGNGFSISYFPQSSNTETYRTTLIHEACGHGFSKLADEYAYEDYGHIPDSEIENRKLLEGYGWWKNADFTDDANIVKWAHFLSDSRYKYDGLGVFEGAFTYWTGAWRPTEESFMRHNTGGFNAPSREAIYIRINKLAFGKDWEYNYEDFVEYDAVNRKTAYSATQSSVGHGTVLRPTTPPVIIKKTWREAIGR